MHIHVQNLAKSYGRKIILKHLNFDLEPGVTAVVGHNGAGKSTLFHILSGRSNQYEGEITVNGVPIENSALKKNILFEESYFYPHLTARENLQYLNDCRGKPLSNMEIDQLMKNWNVCDEAGKSISQYSLGMKKRFSIAAALLNRPDFLILDEPQNGLDMDAQALMENLFTAYRNENKILLFSSHQIENVVSLADRIIILHNGEIKLSLSLKRIIEKSAYMSIRMDKKEIQPFLNESCILDRIDRGDYLDIHISQSGTYQFLQLIVDRRLHIYKMDTALPSLHDILNRLEVKNNECTVHS